MTDPAAFELSDVVAGPADDPILRGVTARIPCGGITVFAGPSGAGKTSLLRLLNRLDDPVSGTVTWGGRPVADWDPPELRRRVGMIFQRPPVFSGTVHGNLLVADHHLARDAAVAALERVGLEPRLIDRAADDLSGGEAQRMAFARALLTGPDMLLADEPTSSLDADSRVHIERLGRDLADDGVPLLWVTHDIDQLRRIADDAVVMVDGGVLAVGTLPELDRHPDPVVRKFVGAT